MLANDNDANADPLVITGVGNAVNGTVAFDSQNNIVTFTPTSGYSGIASFTYTISDGHGGTDTAQVSLSVDPQGGRAERVFSDRHAGDRSPTTTPATSNSE